jgi:hypothetical protein
MLLTYFLNDFEMVPVASIITGITFIIIIIIIIIWYLVRAIKLTIWPWLQLF